MNAVSVRVEEPELAITEYWRGVMERARKAHNLTQRDLADKVGVSQNIISQIETGKLGSSTAVMPICVVLRIPPPHLLLEDETDQRWLEAGRVLRSRDRRLFEQQLAMVEAYAAAVTPEDDERH